MPFHTLTMGQETDKNDATSTATTTSTNDHDNGGRVTNDGIEAAKELELRLAAAAEAPAKVSATVEFMEAKYGDEINPDVIMKGVDDGRTGQEKMGADLLYELFGSDNDDDAEGGGLQPPTDETGAGEWASLSTILTEGPESALQADHTEQHGQYASTSILTSMPTPPGSFQPDLTPLDPTTVSLNIRALKQRILDTSQITIRFNNLRQKYLDLHHQHSTTTAALNDQLSNLNHDNPFLQFQVAQMKDQVAQERSLRTAAEEATSNVERALSAAEEALSVTRAALADTKIFYESKLTHVRELSDNYQKENSKYKVRIVELVSDNRKLLTENHTLKTEQGLNEAVRKGREEVARLEAKCQQFTAQNADLTSQVEQLKNTAMRIRTRNSQLNTDRIEITSREARRYVLPMHISSKLEDLPIDLSFTE